ncbi:MAG TPA: choice-of-anchor D domain-containing protein [Terriglobia bacterium]
MQKITRACGLLAGFSFVLLGGNGASQGEARNTKSENQVPKAALLQNYGKLPLSFEANQGQTDRRVKFLSRGAGYTLFLTGNEAVLALHTQDKSKGKNQKAKIKNEGPDPASRNAKSRLGTADHGPQTTDAILRMRLVGANPGAAVKGTDELSGKANYFIGNDPRKWRTSVPTYAKVRYEGVYPGVDLVYYGNQGQLEYDFVVSPGADPSVIALDVGADSSRQGENGGAKPLGIDRNGDLVVKIEGGEVRFHKPVVYQPATGDRQSRTVVDGHYKLTSRNQVTFDVAKYDSGRPLVIDPALSYSTLLGSSDGYAYTSGIAVDSSGNVYVTGDTASTDFPVTTGAFQSACNIGPDGKCADTFISKMNPSGTALVYSTYLGGGSKDYAYAIAVDASGSAYVTGETESIDFPTTPGAFQTKCNSCNPATNSFNAYVTKLNPSGSALVYSTFLGGSSDNYGQSVAVDASGDAYVSGSTSSSDFPTTPGAFDTVCNACGSGSNYYDAFVSKFNPAGSALVYSTFLGGSSYNDGSGLALDTPGNAYVTGYTASSNFPTTPGAFQTTCNSCVNGYAFVTKLNPSGSALVYSTFLGGSSYNSGNGVAVDSTGDAYVTGTTSSTDFPVTPGAFQAQCGGTGTCGENVFVTKFNPEGSALLYSSYLGGSSDDFPEGVESIAVDSAGQAYLTGLAQSTNFPTTPGAFQTTNAGGECVYFTVVNPGGTSLVYSTYIGPQEDSGGIGLALDSSGNAYVTGFAVNSFPVTPGSFQTACPGDLSPCSFITKFGPGDQVWPLTLDFGNQVIGTTSAAQTATFSNSGQSALSITGITVSGANSSDFTETNNCGTSLAVGATCIITITFAPSAIANRTASITLTDGAPNSPQTVSLSGTGTGPTVTLSPASILYPNQLIGSTSRPQNVTLSTNGTLTITSITTTAEFGETNTCGTGLPPGGSCSISVAFTPTASGTQTGTLTVSDNGGGQSVSLSGTGVGPGVTLSLGTLNFGDETVGVASVAREIKLTNSGSTTLNLTKISLTGANENDFSETNNCGTSLTAGASCTITVIFKPSAAGSRTASVNIADNAYNSPQTVSLTGTGVLPAVTLSPSSLNLGNVLLGSTSAPQNVTLSTNGPISITSITTSAQFAQTNDCGSSLGAGGSCAITVTFTPSALGVQSGTLSVSDSGGGSPQTGSLSGTGVQPAVTFSPTSLTFPAQLVFTTSPPQKVTLTNSGTGTLTITSIVATGNFAQTNNCGNSLGAGGSCTITVTFTPGNKGTLTGAVTVTDSASGSSQSVSLTGTGTFVQLSPTSLNFGSQPVGSTSLPMTITLTNKGGIALGIGSVSIIGANAGDFSIESNTCGSSVARGASCFISVTFTPSADGTRTAQVSIVDNGGGSPQSVGLSGLGTF